MSPAKKYNKRLSVLITGCSDGGIGAALARSFSTKSNIHVYASTRNVAKMSDLSALPNVTLVSLDVTSPDSIHAAVRTIKEATGGTLDILINNAGCGYTMPYLDTDVERAKNVFEVNVWGPMRVTQAFQHMLVEAKGTVVTIGSTAEMLGLAFQGVYCGSKAANHIMSESLRLELEPLGVKCLHVTTSFVKTSWFDNFPEFKLPEESYYLPIAKEIEIKTEAHGYKMMPAASYANRVVGDILKGKQGIVFRGHMASIIALGMAILPRWMMVRQASADSGLSQLTISNPGEQSGIVPRGVGP